VDAENEAQSSGIGVTIIEAREPGDLEAAFSLMATNHIDAVIVLVSPMFHVQRKQIIDRATAMGKPAIYEWKEFVQSGGLISYGADLLDIYRRAASFVDRLLKGAKPADLAVEQPTKFNLVINLKTAKAIGLTISSSLLARADEIIQ
jgi:putative ABC transport system substrate-binding protein